VRFLKGTIKQESDTFAKVSKYFVMSTARGLSRWSIWAIVSVLVSSRRMSVRGVTG
jgi:hypothetical protein